MGNRGSTGRRRNNSINHHHHHEPPPPQPHPQPSQPPEAAGNRYVFAAATPYPPPQYPPPNLLPSPLQHHPPPPPYYQYGMGNYNPPPPSAAPMPLPVPFDLHHRIAGPHAYPYGHMPPPPPSAPMPYVEHQKAVTIRNDVNLKKESLRMVPDEDNPGMFLVAFTFDATTAGCISVLFFAKEGFDCNLTPAKEGLLDSVTIPFNEGLGQKFHQPSGTGISFSMFEEAELTKEGGMEVYPLAVKAEAFPVVPVGLGDDSEDQKTGTPNSQITQAVFVKKENGEYGVRVVKQILWVNETRYELQEIYGIGNSVDGDDLDGSDPGKECVICLSEPRDTTVLPCRHMCMCSDCAKVLRFQTNRCPICRQPVERLLEIKVNNSNNNSSNGSGNRGEEQLQQQEA